MMFDFENAEGLAPDLKRIPPEQLARLVNARARLKNGITVDAQFHRENANWYSADIFVGGVLEVSDMSCEGRIIAAKTAAQKFELELALYFSSLDFPPLRFEP